MASKRSRGRPRLDDTLTPAEWRVVNAVRHGMTSRTIAARRGISVDAVKYHVANALLKIGLGSRAELRLWSGVAHASNLHGKGAIMSDTPMPGPTFGPSLGPIGQISRTVRDIAASIAWYRDVLGLPHLYSFGDMSFFDCGGTRLLLSQGNEHGPQDSLIYFRVADILATHKVLAAKGVVFVAAPHLIHRHGDGTEEWMAFFEDIEGRPLGIMSQIPVQGL